MQKKITLIVLSFFCFQLLVHAQQIPENSPNLSVACSSPAQFISSNDTVICIGDSVQLFAQNSFGSPLWLPFDDVLNPYVEDAIVFPTESRYYYFIQTFLDSTNLIYNGDFEFGNIGFSSQYGLAPINWDNMVNPEGLYQITNNPAFVFTEFEDCRDYPTGSGDMLVANGGENNELVWCQTIPVDPDQNYFFQGWFSAITKKAPYAEIQVQINGVDMWTSLDLTPSGWTTFTCDWKTIAGTWYSGTATTADICIYNLEDTDHGNDFAIDHLSFRSNCYIYDSVYVEVSDMQVDTEIDTLICFNQGLGEIRANVTTSAGIASFEWQGFPNNDSLTLPNLPAGSYNFYVEDSLGCYKDLDLEVTQPDSLEAVLELDSSNCEGASVGITAPTGGTTPYLYQWNTGANGQTIDPATSGFYAVTVVDANNCIWRDSAQLNAIPLLELEISGDSLTCDPSQSATIQVNVLSGEGPYNFSWSNAATDSTIQVFEAGNYQVVVVDQNGCSKNIAYDIWAPYRPNLSPYISPEVINDTIFIGADLVLNAEAYEQAATDFTWNSANASELGITTFSGPSIVLQPNTEGSYWVYVDASSEDGCTDADSILIHIKELPFYGIPTAFTPNGDDINESFYPIDVPPNYIEQFQVFDRWGQLIYDMDNAGFYKNGLKGWEGNFQGKAQPADAYIYKIILDFPGFAKQILRGQVTLLR